MVWWTGKPNHSREAAPWRDHLKRGVELWRWQLVESRRKRRRRGSIGCFDSFALLCARTLARAVYRAKQADKRAQPRPPRHTNQKRRDARTPAGPLPRVEEKPMAAQRRARFGSGHSTTQVPPPAAWSAVRATLALGALADVCLGQPCPSPAPSCPQAGIWGYVPICATINFSSVPSAVDGSCRACGAPTPPP